MNNKTIITALFALCTVSLSSHKEAGQIRFRILGQSGYRRYSLTAHRWQLFEKLDVANITEAIAFATNYGLL